MRLTTEEEARIRAAAKDHEMVYPVDASALLAELDETRRERDDLSDEIATVLRDCDSMGLMPFTFRSDRITTLVLRLTEERNRYRDAILWADGQGDDFRPRPEGKGPYWWRRELMERAGLARSHVAALPTPNQCDGCRRGLPVRGGVHYNPHGSHDMIGCTAGRYAPSPAAAPGAE